MIPDVQNRTEMACSTHVDSWGLQDSPEFPVINHCRVIPSDSAFH